MSKYTEIIENGIKNDKKNHVILESIYDVFGASCIVLDERMAIMREIDERRNIVDPCGICGHSMQHSLEGWKEQGVCSGRCWAELFGEP